MSRPTTPTAVVTGARRGFGRAIAAALVAAGTRVVGVARDADDLHAVRERARPRLHPRRRRRHRRGARPRRDPRAPARPARPQRRCPAAHGAGARADLGDASAATGTPTPGTPSPGSARRCGSRWRRAAWSSRCPAGPRCAGRRSAAGTPGPRPPCATCRATRAASPSGPGWASGSSRCCPRMTPGRRGRRGRASRATRRARASTRTPWSPGHAPILTAEQVGEAVLELVADPDAAPEYQLSSAGMRPID